MGGVSGTHHHVEKKINIKKILSFNQNTLCSQASYNMNVARDN